MHERIQCHHLHRQIEIATSFSPFFLLMIFSTSPVGLWPTAIYPEFSGFFYIFLFFYTLSVFPGCAATRAPSNGGNIVTAGNAVKSHANDPDNKYNNTG